MNPALAVGGGAWRWGRAILLVLYALLVVNGGWIYLYQLAPPMFERDTGLSLWEVQASYPQVIRYLGFEVRFAALLLTGVGAIGFVTALSLAGGDDRRLWRLLWLPVALLAALAMLILSSAEAGVGLYYLALAMIAAIAQLLLRGAESADPP